MKKLVCFESVKLGFITVMSMVVYFFMGANIETAALVAILGALYPVLLAVGHKKGNPTVKKYSVVPLMIAAIIVLFGNIWAMFVLLAQTLFNLYYIKPATLVEEIDDMA